ncbi:MAG: AMP-binding protein [Alphaproteobacteria bacterium]|nr:AMP-binding protein [Alphaproteobacteria bacterium]
MQRVDHIVHAAAAAWPDRLAVHDSAGALTFAELAAAVDAVAAQLTAQGVGAGMGLGVMAGNGCAFLVGVFAGLATGATVMPIAPGLKRAELDGLQAGARLHAVVDDRSGLAPFDAEGVAIDVAGASWRLAWSAEAPARPMVEGVDDPAFVRFTSGTTGAAKGVVIGHRAVLERTAAAERWMGIGPGDTVVWVLPMAYHFIVTLVMYVRYGVTVAVAPDLLARTLLDTVRAHDATLLYAAPTHYRMLAADTSGLTMPTLRRAISTSAGIPHDVAVAFARRHGLPVTQVYGIIELGLPAGNLDACAEHPDSIGRAMPGFEVQVQDDDGAPVAVGTIGHLAMRGPGMFDAYLAPFRPAADVLVRGWFMTGDLAVCDADGLITVAGRRKSMINAAGLKVFPEEVEAVLDAAPGVVASRVSGAPHPVMGEVVVAEVVLAPGVALDATALRAFVRERLSMYKVPHRITAVDAIARTATGKVARHVDDTVR